MFNQSHKSVAEGYQTAGVETANLSSVRQLIHRQLIDSLETEGPGTLLNVANVKKQIGWLLEDLEEKNGLKYSTDEKNLLELEIIEELAGMGPLASLMIDNDISDILVNGPDEVWIDKFGYLEKTNIRFDDHAHVRRFLDRVLSNQGRALDSSSPMVDAKLVDGSRIHAIASPLCACGPVISIRKFQQQRNTLKELVEQEFMTVTMLEFLRLAVESGMNIVIAGGASSGKTSLLNNLSTFIPDNDRVITIEETSELNLQHGHVVSLEGRTSNMEGKGEVALHDLLRAALRMRADRIIVGEVRGTEVFDMLQAMNVGHDGSMTTLHANSPEDVLNRMETLSLTCGTNLSRESIRGMIGSAIQLIVQLTRYNDGTRRISSICELINQDGILSTNELFYFNPGTNSDNSGRHTYTGQPIQFIHRIQQRGYDTSTLDRQLKTDTGAGVQKND